MVPATVGVKSTASLQLAPDARLEPHALDVMAKFPVAAIELMLTEEELVFFSVMVFVALVVPTSCGVNVSPSGVGVTIGLLATLKGRA